MTDALVGAVEPTPHHEGPRGTVPQAAEQHGEHEVAVGGRLGAPIAPEGDVEVVPQPTRERDVPAPPEVLDGQGRVGTVEVLREADAEQQGDADRDVRVAAEVGVDLHCVAIDREEDLEAGEVAGDGEDGVDHLGAEPARDHDLLEQPRHDEEEGLGGRDAVLVGAAP